MEERRVAKEAFRHVSGALSAAVADLDVVPPRSAIVSPRADIVLFWPFILGSGLL